VEAVMARIPVRIDSSRPIFIEADVESFGEVFAMANSQEQARILKAMFDSVRPLGCQLDYIWMELAGDEYRDTREALASLIAPQESQP
jgi:hypothetical protein